MKLAPLNGWKSKKNFERTRHVKNNNKCKKYYLFGQRNVMFNTI